jgi:hypothetical protein
MRTKLVIAGLLLALVATGAYWLWPQGARLTETDTVLLANFTNSTGDPAFDSSLREALAVSLAQSPMLNLTSEEKRSEVLRGQGIASDAPLTRPHILSG